MRNMRFMKNVGKRIGAFALALATVVSAVPMQKVRAESKPAVNADRKSVV